MEMKWNSNHQRDDDDGSEVPNRESKRRCSLADVDGDPIREHELETKLEAMMKRVGVLEKKLESFHHSSSSVDGDAMRQRELETKLEAMVKRVEELEEKLASFHHSSSRSSFDPSQRRGFQLHFDGKLLATTYTYSGIESEDSKPVKIVIYDASNKIISSGPLSSMKVGIVPLDGDFGANDQGDWTEQEFNAKIVHAREGKKPLVTGELEIILRNGVGEIKNVSFTDNSSWIRSRRFRLGARAVSSIPNEVRVREARSEPFMVKDQRGEPYKKRHPPHLDDEIWRLEIISKDGVFHKRLSGKGITTIQHFLKSYYMDPSSLRKLLGISDKRWKTITEHATACVPDEKLYAYHREGETLVFNSVFKVVGGIFGGQIYHSRDELCAVHKDLVDNMTIHAYKNMNDFVQLDQPWLFHSLPSNLLADQFANPIASLQHSNFAGLNQGQLDIPPDSNLFASPEYTNVTQDYSLPEGYGNPYFHPTATSFCSNWPPSMQIGENYQAETSTRESNGWFSTQSRGGAGWLLSSKSGRRKAWWFMIRAALKWVMSPRRAVAF
ncbi:calmodulin-binding protein 60 B-like isoform X9 [Diospyros lotus]|uniref:calmodulin-binding protein 60 B-like isoform X9 n=1 Tax=Diospyros lotus TaxID=55363 RepID=UPI00224DB098|nr:calmodulin-binding protein 60 B-like isoform X9 [Diospyros lotus]